MPHTVEITSRVRKRINGVLLRQACEAALRHKRVRTAEISILVVGDRGIRRFNRELLGHDRVTDVIAIDLGAAPGLDLLGQLILCRPVAQRQAQRRGISESAELARYAIHGTLHLLGYRDGTEAEREEMWKVQERLVRLL